MTEPKGLLVIPIGFNPSGDIRAVTVSADDYLNVVLETGLTGGGMGEPKGKIVTICGYDPEGNLRAIEVDANDNLLVSLLGGLANQIIKSDGTDAEWDTLANVLEAALLTADGDILIRTGGVAQRLAKGSDDEILTLASGIPSWTVPAINAILTADGDIYIRSGGVVTRLAKGSDDELLSLVSGLPAWVAAPSGGYTEGVRVYNSADQNIPNNVLTDITFNAETYDTDSIHDTGSNTARLTCKTAGKYLIAANIGYYNNATGYRGAHILLNGTTYIAANERGAVSGRNTYLATTTLYDLAVDDYVKCIAFQNSGITLAIKYHAEYTPYFMMQRIG